LLPIITSKCSKANAGAIAGGVIGGVAGLAIIAIILYLIVRRRNKEKNESADLPLEGDHVFFHLLTFLRKNCLFEGCYYWS
jgi:nitrate reductase gamma subunit